MTPRPSRRTAARCLLIALATILLSGVARAESIVCPTELVPVERILANLRAQAANAPESWQAHYGVGRASALAYARKASSLPVCGTVPVLSERMDLGNEHRQPGVAATTEKNRIEAQRHLAAAVLAYERAVALAPDQAIARIGDAWALEQAGRAAAAASEYRAAIALAWPADRDANERQPVTGPDGQVVFTLGVQPGYVFLTEEAIRHLLRLLDRTQDAAEIAELTRRAEFMQRGPRGLSPIVIPLRPGATLTDLVNRSARVKFDLDGWGPREWTWITPDAGWLVFDPRRSGRIESGLQLFGNVTFWMFWGTGYDALRALDDDGDGLLRGPELAGLAVWRDADGDGVSRKDELLSLPDTGIVELSTRHVVDDENGDLLAFSAAGARFADGTTRTTYDVVLHEMPPAEP